MYSARFSPGQRGGSSRKKRISPGMLWTADILLDMALVNAFYAFTNQAYDIFSDLLEHGNGNDGPEGGDQVVRPLRFHAGCAAKTSAKDPQPRKGRSRTCGIRCIPNRRLAQKLPQVYRLLDSLQQAGQETVRTRALE